MSSSITRARASGIVGVLAVVVALSISITAEAQTPAADLTIGLSHSLQMGDIVDVPIQLNVNDPGFQIAGFEFLIGYDPVIAAFISAAPGQVLQDCAWEYFTFSVDTINPADCSGFDCPTHLIRLVAIADLNNGSPHPSCLAETSGILATLRFRATNDANYNCQFMSLKWIWADCGDNAVSAPAGALVLSSSSEPEPIGVVLAPDSTFPTFTGAPAECDGPQITRNLRFVAGGLDLPCIDSIDSRGDINLNDLSYEIADWMMFRNYLLHGLPAFPTDKFASAINSSVNWDNSVLTVADFWYLYRIVIGDALPIPRTEAALTLSDTAAIDQDTEARTVSFTAANGLGPLQMVFSGEVIPTEGMYNGYGIFWHYDSTLTRVLLLPWDTATNWVTQPLPGPMPSGTLFHYTGDGQLIDADATFDGEQVIPILLANGTTGCCRHRGNVEGDSDPSRNVDLTDLMMLIDYVFGSPGGTTLTCTDEADMNLDYQFDLTDIMSLVDYLFNSDQLIPCN